MYFYLLGKCYFVNVDIQNYDNAIESCKTRFGNHLLGRLFEPKSIDVSRAVYDDAHGITGITKFWIGIRQSGNPWYYGSGGRIAFSGYF